MTDSFNCFVIFQRKSFMKFTGILFDVPEELLTVKTALCNDLILSLPENKSCSKSSLDKQGKSVKYIQI